MEFQTYAAAGRISELIGEKAIDYDLQQRRFGMVSGAENTQKEIEKDPECREAAEAYTEGVNAGSARLKNGIFLLNTRYLITSPSRGRL
jgi:penicillin amidase